MAKQNKEYVYVDCYQCDENGKSSPWKRKHLDDVPKWQHEEAKDFNCFATVQKYANEKKTCLLYTSPSPRDISGSRMPSSA